MSFCRNQTLFALCAIGIAAPCAALLAAADAHAQASSPSAQAPAAPINLGGREWSAAENTHAAPENAKSELGFEVRGGLVSDYVYRGVTLSDRKPAIGAAIEATYDRFYAGLTVASVRLPTQPAAEISMSGGIRPKLGMVDLDLGVIYFKYPGENPAAESKRIDY